MNLQWRRHEQVAPISRPAGAQQQDIVWPNSHTSERRFEKAWSAIKI
jgi:hypothetical protein